MIQYVLEALLGSKNIGRIFVATSLRVKHTNEWLDNFKKDHREIEIIHTQGAGFVHDMIGAVEEAGIRESVLI
ncbi:MAG: hypothetical protein QSU88_11165, partial [Candidatus Methanoperedens sp.]|nr:hypothetical protein [Candidatus Methanoperedens sp.]